MQRSQPMQMELAAACLRRPFNMKPYTQPHGVGSMLGSVASSQTAAPTSPLTSVYRWAVPAIVFALY